MALASLSFTDLLARVGAREPTPGGGSVAALTGALGTSLAIMAIRFSGGGDGEAGEELRDVLHALESSLHEMQGRLNGLADEDAAAYQRFRDAGDLPRGSDAEKADRSAAIEAALAAAADVPLRTARLCRDGLEMLQGVADRLSPHLATDVAGGAGLLAAGCRGALLNVRVNAGSMQDVARSASLKSDCDRLESRAANLLSSIDSWALGVLQAGWSPS